MKVNAFYVKDKVVILKLKLTDESSISFMIMDKKIKYFGVNRMYSDILRKITFRRNKRSLSRLLRLYLEYLKTLKRIFNKMEGCMVPILSLSSPPEDIGFTILDSVTEKYLYSSTEYPVINLINGSSCPLMDFDKYGVVEGPIALRTPRRSNYDLCQKVQKLYDNFIKLSQELIYPML